MLTLFVCAMWAAILIKAASEQSHLKVAGEAILTSLLLSIIGDVTIVWRLLSYLGSRG